MKRRTLLAAMGASVLMPVQAKDMPNQAVETGWQNWSKSIAPQNAEIAVPRDAAALKKLLGETEGGVRPVGSGHSWTGLVPCDGAIVKLDHFNGIGAVDAQAQTAWLGAGARLKDLSPALAAHGLAFRNLGDIDVQSLAGATSTATHGTGRELPVWRQKFAACVWSPVPVRKWRSAPRKMLICCLPRKWRWARSAFIRKFKCN